MKKFLPKTSTDDKFDQKSRLPVRVYCYIKAMSVPEADIVGEMNEIIDRYIHSFQITFSLDMEDFIKPGNQLLLGKQASEWFEKRSKIWKLPMVTLLKMTKDLWNLF